MWKGGGWVPLSWFRLEWTLYSSHFPHFPHQLFEDFLLRDGRFFRIFFDSFSIFEVRTLSFLMFENLQSLRKLLPVQTRNSNFLNCLWKNLSISFFLYLTLWWGNCSKSIWDTSNSLLSCPSPPILMRNTKKTRKINHIFWTWIYIYRTFNLYWLTQIVIKIWWRDCMTFYFDSMKLRHLFT